MTNLVENLAATTNQGDLARELQRLRDAEGVTFTAITNKTGIGWSVISQLMNQGLRMRPGRERKPWDAVNEIKSTEGRPGPDTLVMPIHSKMRIELFEAEEFKECMGWCNYVRNKREIGVVVGHSDNDKTTVLRHFVQTQPGVLYIEVWPQMRAGGMLGAIARSLGPSLRSNNYRKTQDLIACLSNRTGVPVTVDEAEYLVKWDVDKFKVLCKARDDTGTPVVLYGMGVLEGMLTRGHGHHNNLAQLYRRKVELKLNGVGRAGARTILREYNTSDDAASALVTIAADVKRGGTGIFVKIPDICPGTVEGGQITDDVLTSVRKHKLIYQGGQRENTDSHLPGGDGCGLRLRRGRLLLQMTRPCGWNVGVDHRGHWADPDHADGGDGMKTAYARIKEPRRVTDDPMIYVCSPYAADPERNVRRVENFCHYVWKMGGIPLTPHLLLPRFTNKNRRKERETGLRMARKLLGIHDEMWVLGGKIIEASARYILIHHHDDPITLTIARDGGDPNRWS